MELEKPIVAPFKILVIVAHPDDIEFGSAGSVAVWTGAGAEVTYCIVTDGAAGSNDKDVVYNQLVERRQAEQLEAAEIVEPTRVVCVGVGHEHRVYLCQAVRERLSAEFRGGVNQERDAARAYDGRGARAFIS